MGSGNACLLISPLSPRKPENPERELSKRRVRDIRLMKKSATPNVDSKGDPSSRTKHGRQSAGRFLIKELGGESWPDFARTVEKHDGVWGGCWCMTFHFKRDVRYPSLAKKKADKEKLVRANQSHAALVYDGTDVVGWCQFGPPAELPGRMSGYGRLDLAPPDWRITCFFVDRDHRREGVAKAALEGALRMIAAKGGGTVDGYPTAIPRGKPYSSSFLWSGTQSMFAKLGFRPLGQLGTSKWMMRKVVRSR